MGATGRGKQDFLIHSGIHIDNSKKFRNPRPALSLPLHIPSTGVALVPPQLPPTPPTLSNHKDPWRAGRGGGVQIHWGKASNLHLQIQNPTEEIFMSLMTHQGFMFSVAPAL